MEGHRDPNPAKIVLGLEVVDQFTDGNLVGRRFPNAEVGSSLGIAVSLTPSPWTELRGLWEHGLGLHQCQNGSYNAGLEQSRSAKSLEMLRVQLLQSSITVV